MPKIVVSDKSVICHIYILKMKCRAVIKKKKIYIQIPNLPVKKSNISDCCITAALV